MTKDEIGNYECINKPFQNLVTNLIDAHISETNKIIENLKTSAGAPADPKLIDVFIAIGKEQINDLENSKKSIENAKTCGI